jgi:AcrR family transcriptional regulator
MTSTGRIDPRVTRTRQLLRNAFIELMQEKGFATIRIEDIAERATINRATFYTHFENKHQFLDSLIREEIRQHFTSQLPLALRWDERTLRIVIQIVLKYVQETQNHYCSSVQMLRPMMQQAIQEELFDVLMNLFPQPAAFGSAPSITRELLAWTSSWAIYGAALQWSREPHARSVESMADALLTVITQGVAHLTPSFEQTENLILSTEE